MKHPDAELLAALVNEHLSSDDVVAIVRGTADAELVRYAECHRELCAACDEEVIDLMAFARPRHNRRWTWMAAAAAVIIVIIAGVMLLRAPQQPAVVTATIANTTTASVEEKPVASLRDHGRVIALFAGGRIEGVTVSNDEAALLRDALTRGTIELPREVRALAPLAATVRAADAKPRFDVIAPVGTVVLDARPEFRWNALPGARAYSVTVFDRDFRPVAESGAIDITRWRPTQPLPRDTTLTWQVAAQTAEGETIAPAPEAGETRFRVASETTMRALRDGERRWRESHLMLGLAYARHGALAEARRELELVAKENHDSALTMRLLASVALRE